jgi:MerR family gold-responsive transcriptional activator of gol and ges genes
MNIGEASKASKISAKMIRYYEQIGLIPPASRTDVGYRAYSLSDIHRLHFIRNARDMGFSVAEIANLLSLWSDRSRQSADVKRLAQQHIAELEQRMAAMRQMADTLATLIDCCAGDERPDCPILQNLEQVHDTLREPEQRSGAVLKQHYGVRARTTGEG